VTRSISSLVVAAAVATASVVGAAAPAGAQMMDACMIPDVPAYPGAPPASGEMLGMRAGMAHRVSIWATNDSLGAVVNYYRGQLAGDGFVDGTPGIAQSLPGNAQTSGNSGELINSVELSKDGRQFVYIAGTSPGFMLAVGCR
jgi:hypothetical protein